MVDSNLRGIAFMALAVAVLSVMDAGMKWLILHDIPVIQIIAIRGWLIVVFMLLLAAVRYDITILRTAKLKQHIIRSVLGFAAPMMFFTSLKFMSLATATAVSFSGIFFMTAGSAWLMSEPVGRHRWLAVVVGFMGVLVIVRPGTDFFSPVALLPAGGAAAYAMMMLWGRHLSKTESTFNMVFYFNLVFAAMASLALPFVWSGLSLQLVIVLLVVSAVALAGYYLMTRAFTLTSVGVIAPFEYTALVWAFLLDALLWGAVPELNSALGMSIIVASGLYILYRERRKKSLSS